MATKSKINRLENTKIFLITGGCGFIGSHFVDLMLQDGHTIINIDNLTYASNPKLNDAWLKNKNYSFIKEDIADLKDIPYCDFVVNFAASSHVDNSIDNSFDFVKSNILGVYNLLEILKNKKIESMKLAWEYKYPVFLQISTDEVFSDTEKGFFKENDRHKPSNPYSATKSSAEQLVVAWARTYEIPYIITRTTNNYGARQHPEKLIPKAITSILKNEKIPIHGGGRYVRNWIHVKDNVEAIKFILSHGKIGQAYHISSDEEYSVREVVQMICDKMSVNYDDCTNTNVDRSGADVRYALNREKIKKLGWDIKRDFKGSLDEVIKFYKEEIV